jgi:hypothetical protein
VIADKPYGEFLDKGIEPSVSRRDAPRPDYSYIQLHEAVLDSPFYKTVRHGTIRHHLKILTSILMTAAKSNIARKHWQHPFRKPAPALLMLMLVAILFLLQWFPVSATAETDKKRDGAPTKRAAEEAVTVKELSFHIEAAKEELLLTLDRFYIPEISRIEGDKPRVVLDLHPVANFPQKDYSKTTVNGRYIRQLRSYHNRKEKKLRIVLDMNDSLNYYAQPSFIKSQNLFKLEITEAASHK